MTNPPQVDIVRSHVQDAIDKGAEVPVGGKAPEGPGQFFEPTVLTGVDHTMKIMTEETFGPTLPIMKVRDADEAVQLANDSRYGLNSSVFSKDVAKGEAVARRLEAGNACVNDALMNYLALEAPFGGANESGLGARHGAPGIRKYCATQTILITRFGRQARADDVPQQGRDGEGVRAADGPDVRPAPQAPRASAPRNFARQEARRRVSLRYAMRYWPWRAAAVLAIAGFALLAGISSATAATLPTGFEERTVVSGLTAPTAVAWAPDGRMFVAEKGGKVRVVTAAGALVSKPLSTSPAM